MKICVRCESEQADELERCGLCGGELRRRSVSEAINTLFDDNTSEAASTRTSCPHCGSTLLMNCSTKVCSRCGATIARTEGAEDRAMSQTLRP